MKRHDGIVISIESYNAWRSAFSDAEDAVRAAYELAAVRWREIARLRGAMKLEAEYHHAQYQQMVGHAPERAMWHLTRAQRLTEEANGEPIQPTVA